MTTEQHCCATCYWWDGEWDEGGAEGRECHHTVGGGHFSLPGFDCLGYKPTSLKDPAPWSREAKRKKKDPAAVKRGKSAKKKGKGGEKESGDVVCGIVGGRYYRQGDKESHRDVEFVDNCFEGELHMETKRHARFAMEKHCVQAEGDAATHGLHRWIVAWRPDGQTRWRMSSDLIDYAKDMYELACLREAALKQGEE